MPERAATSEVIGLIMSAPLLYSMKSVVILLVSPHHSFPKFDPEKLALLLKYARRVTAGLPSLVEAFVRAVAREQGIHLPGQ